MPFHLNENEISSLENSIWANDTEFVHSRVGLFISRFGMVEYGLSTLMMFVFEARNTEKFDFIMRGMDSRSKIERLMSGDGLHYVLGKNLKLRLEYLKKNSLPIRNHIAHSFISFHEKNLHFSSWSAAPHVDGVKNTITGAPYISFRDLFIEAIWLEHFFNDLIKIRPQTSEISQFSRFEISSPGSSLPQEGRLPTLRKVPHAIPRMREK